MKAAKKQRRKIQKAINHLNKADDRVYQLEQLTRRELPVIMSFVRDARRHLLVLATAAGFEIDEDRRA